MISRHSKNTCSIKFKDLNILDFRRVKVLYKKIPLFIDFTYFLNNNKEKNIYM